MREANFDTPTACRFSQAFLTRSTVDLNPDDGRPAMGAKERIGQLFSRGVERRGDDYVVRYEDDTGTHERVFEKRREARNFQTSFTMGTVFIAGAAGGFGGDSDGGGGFGGGLDGGGGDGGGRRRRRRGRLTVFSRRFLERG